MFYAICYDIRDDKRRLKAVKALKDFGARVQYSVFEAELESGQLERLIKRLSRVLDPKEDDLRVYPMCAACADRIQMIGDGHRTRDEDFVIV